jgi:hypothetical protein
LPCPKDNARHNQAIVIFGGSEVSVKVEDLSEEELAVLIRGAVEDALADVLGFTDPDAGLDLRPEVRQRLLESARRVQAGERGSSLEDVARRLRRAP